MAIEPEPHGAQFLAEIRKLRRLDLITNKLDYRTIQKFKQAHRKAMLKPFCGSSYALL